MHIKWHQYGEGREPYGQGSAMSEGHQLWKTLPGMPYLSRVAAPKRATLLSNLTLNTLDDPHWGDSNMA